MYVGGFSYSLVLKHYKVIIKITIQSYDFTIVRKLKSLPNSQHKPNKTNSLNLAFFKLF